MTPLEKWASRWGVSDRALADLPNHFYDQPEQRYTSDATEAGAQVRVRLEASRLGGRLWRNNVGVTVNPQGRVIRFGLCNDSAKVNRETKSSDLIGIMPVRIEPHHVGTTIGRFTAREIKAPGWEYTGTDRERGQLNFLKLVSSLGGDAAFATSEGTL